MKTNRNAYVKANVADERLGPCESARVVNGLYHGQKVEIHEETGGWARVTSYYRNHPDGERVARWVKAAELSPNEPPPPRHGLPDTRLGNALAKSDGVARYWRRFLREAKRAIERGLATEDDFVEWGGWTRSCTDGYYFVHTETRVVGRVYVHAPSGKLAQWHPWMDGAEVAKYLYQKQNGICVLCAERFRPRNLVVDHIVPRRMGRVDKLRNLQLLCPACNGFKGDRSMAWAIGTLKDAGTR